ncbi:phasin family protein [Alteribacillus sp. JSM 102045]|uniref:phasin family protein n=1 Tax=Alteribacillus sp. JSM 102045 TaxID=1562101 RepID=UPI0035C1A167
MNDMLKKGFFLGLGAAAYGKEKIQNYVDDLVSRGKITPREAEQWKEEFIQRGRDTEMEWSFQAKDKMQDAFKEMGLATEKDINAIEQKLHDIEQKLEFHINNSSQKDNE